MKNNGIVITCDGRCKKLKSNYIYYIQLWQVIFDGEFTITNFFTSSVLAQKIAESLKKIYM